MANFLSLTDLKVRVARKLQILHDSESLSAEDGELIGAALDSVETALSTLGIVNLDLETGISEPLADPVAMMGAAYLVDEYQIPEPRRAILRAEGMIGIPGRSIAERQVRALAEAPTVKLAATTDVTVI